MKILSINANMTTATAATILTLKRKLLKIKLLIRLKIKSKIYPPGPSYPHPNLKLHGKELSLGDLHRLLGVLKMNRLERFVIIFLLKSKIYLVKIHLCYKNTISFIQLVSVYLILHY